MKKLLTMSALFLAVCLLFTISANADATELPQKDDNNTIKLTQDVTLAATYNVNSSQTVIIDLNGYTLKGPSSAYLINNNGGKVTIVDNGKTKGKIVGVYAEKAVINNAGTLTVDGVTIVSNLNKMPKGVIASNKSLTIKDSSVSTTGRAFALWVTGGTATVIDSTLSGDTAIYSEAGSKTTVSGGEIKGSLGLTQKGELKITGEVTGRFKDNIFRYLQSGSTLVIAEDQTIDSSIHPTQTLGEGVNLKIKDNAKVTVAEGGMLEVGGTVTGKVDSTVYNETTNSYFGTMEKALNFADKEKENKLVLQKNTTEKEFLLDQAKEAGALISDKNVVIDLNGYTLETEVKNTADGKMKIVDSSKNKKGTFKGTLTNEGTLTVEAGNFTKMPVTAEKASTTLNGGTYPINELQNAVIPEGKELVKNADGTYSIKDIVPPANEENNEEEIEEDEKDDTADTGIENVYVVAGIIVLVTIAGAIILNKRK